MYDINVFENIRYNIDKTMMKDGEFYLAVITYLNGKKMTARYKLYCGNLVTQKRMAIFSLI